MRLPEISGFRSGSFAALATLLSRIRLGGILNGLVTGSSGLIRSAVVEHYDDLGQQVQGVDKMLAVLENALEQYNESNAVMDLVLFEDAMKHIARISRADSA